MKKDKSKSNPSWAILFKGMSTEALKLSFQTHREYILSKDEYTATDNDNYWAISLAIRDRLVERWIKTQQHYHKDNVKRVYYLSLEFLIGRLFGNNMYNLGLEKALQEMADELGLDLDNIRDQETDAGLGNGGLGRLAACFLDSMATLGIPAHGYGIRYDYGIFNQKITDGHQVELPDEWARWGIPWEFARPEYTERIKFYGKVKLEHDDKGRLFVDWIETEDILAVPYDIPIPGYKNDIVNTLRLWSARSTEDFDLKYFNSGDYEQAVYRKIYSENISKVLYPSDALSQGKELRLKQEYFFTAASIADILRRFKVENSDFRHLPDKVVIQLNDTHPTLAIVELLRLLLDEYKLEWDNAWDVVKHSFAYTNHTLMPEALESWPVTLLEKLLPRHMQLIYEINRRFLEEVEAKFPKDYERLRRMSLIEEGAVKKVRMAHLAVVGSFSVNGVSELHSDLLKTRVLKDFYEFYPQKFNNKTNGITPRRWLLKANPTLSDMISQTIGNGWVKNLDQLELLIPHKENPAFREKWRAIKSENKKQLAEYIERSNGIKIDLQSIFDVQVKRIHEYKRQLLFALYIWREYLKIKNDPKSFIYPRTFILGGKAAPGYYLAKLSIKFFNNLAKMINKDKSVRDKIQMVFLENYRVSLAEKIFPASELSEQISTAGTEASGTGNMKFMINGALTIGTYDGANIEIAQQVGAENIFIFGLKAHDVDALKAKGYRPQQYVQSSAYLNQIFQLMSRGTLNEDTAGLFDPLIEAIFYTDQYLVCADFDNYCACQDEVSKMYLNKDEWTKKSIMNVAKSGFFSSDRTIREYAKHIWGMDQTSTNNKGQKSSVLSRS